MTRRLAGLQELPAHIRAYAETHYPDFLHAPTEWQEPNVTSYEVYARDNEPVT